MILGGLLLFACSSNGIIPPPPSLLRQDQLPVNFSATEIRKIEFSAKRGNANALYTMGWLSQYGHQDSGIPQNYKMAHTWYEQAVKKNHAESLVALGYLYELGLGVERNVERSLTYYFRSSQLGNPRGQYNVGRLIEQAGIEENVYLGKKPSAKPGGKGLTDLGGVLIASYGALNWYLAAAVQELPQAQLAVGLKLEVGEAGRPAEPLSAAVLYQLAAKKGSREARRRVGWMYDAGYNVPKDRALATNLLRGLDKTGDLVAGFRLGVGYQYGLGVPKNLGTAQRIYQKNANQNEPRGVFALAYNTHVKGDEEGSAGSAEIIRAMQLYERAASLGEVEALTNLGYLHYRKLAPNASLEQGIEYFKQAAELNSSSAQAYLGWAYIVGVGVKKNEKQGLSLLKRAADRNNPTAQYNLAFLYAKGEVVEAPDLKKSIFWLIIAERTDDKKIQASVKRFKTAILSRISSDLLKEARQEVSSWQPKL